MRGPGNDEVKALLRRIGRSPGRFGLSIRLYPPLDNAHRPDRALKQQQERDRERHLAEHVGRR